MAIRNLRRGAAVLALSAACLGGCELPPKTAPATPPAPAPQAPRPAEPTVKVGPREAAEVKVEFAHVLEKSDPAAAMNGYLEAHKHDPSNLDALLGIARLLDADGRFAESMVYYRKAEKAKPSNAKVACNYGYSLYLQGRYGEAETALRQALARQPASAQSHNNLGMVLARTGRPADALTEFRRAGCNDADARVNLAFALTLQKSWAEARVQYQRALALDPSSAAARKGLRDLDLVVARAGQPGETAEAGE
jgi:Tfp pilus assembly protein PilF